MKLPVGVTVVLFDLLNVLDYTDQFIPKFKDLMWDEICECYNVSNNIELKMNLSNFLDRSDIIEDGVKFIEENIPNAIGSNVVFSICW